MKIYNVVFFGTPDFSVPSLDLLDNHPQINIKYVISMPDRKAGRGYELKSPEVIEYAKNNKINYFQTENINKESDFLANLETESIDFFVVLAFAQFLGTKLLELPALGCFNIHTSLLPKYRGAAPIQYALLNGDTETGVSIQKMVKKMDAGDIVHSYPIKASMTETGGQLYTRLKLQAALSLNIFIQDIIEDKVTYTVQDESLVSFAPTLKREDGYLDFKNETKEVIKNKVRALFPWPGTFCKLNKKRLKVFAVVENSTKLEAGTVNTTYGEIIIGCLDGSLRLSSIQLEGKKSCSDRELLNGMKGDILLNP
jgi:methionyl-tRNA formyltransferase